MGDRRGSGVVPLRPWPAVVVAAALVGVLCSGAVLSGCALFGGERVTVFGDSITSLGANVMEEQLGGEYSLDIDGVFGATIADRLAAASEAAATGPDQVVINLGTNDVVHGAAIDAAARDLDAMVGLFGDADCVHVVTLNTNVTVDGERFTEPAEELNRAIEALSEAHPNVDVVRWDLIQQAAVDDGGGSTALTSDGVHPTDEGQRLLAEAYDDALGSCPRIP